MEIRVIDEKGCAFIFNNNLDAFEMVQRIREKYPNEKIRIEVE